MDSNAGKQWDARFSGESWAYGKAPNEFLAAQVHRLPAEAMVLCLAEGEGRNGVHLATLGHRVTGVDASKVGLEKARRLAAEKGVELETVVADLADYPIEKEAWDAVVLIFAHFPEGLRRKVFAEVVQGLRPGGLVLLEAYTPRQLEFRTGGPPIPEMLYTAEMLRADFTGLEMVELQEIERDVVEGELHRGRAAVVQMVARKP